MRDLFHSLTRGGKGAAQVGWGDVSMTYLGDGVYLREDGTLLDTDPSR